MREEGKLEARSEHKPPTRELGLGRCGTVGGAAALAFAIVLACVLAAALTLAIVLAFAGVLGCVWGLVISNQKHAGLGSCTDGGLAALLGRLRVQTCGGTAEQACERCGDGESIYGVVLHG